MQIRQRLLYALLILFTATSLGMIGYMALDPQPVSLLDALYRSVLTMAGMGINEVVEQRGPMLRIFNIFVVLIGVTLMVYVFSSFTAFLVEGEITNIFWRRKMQKRIGEMKNHYIVCGLGDTGRHAVEELQKTATPYVVIEHHEENVRRFQEHAGQAYKDMAYIVGDAADEEVLEQAGLGRASGLLSTLPADKENLVITLMVRQKNPNIRIVTRCTDLKYSERMAKVGANAVVSPNHIGGLRLASEVLRPHVVGFLDLMLKEQSRTLRVEEIAVSFNSPWENKTLREVNLRGAYNLLPLAVKNGVNPTRGNFWVNPPDELKLQEGVVIIIMGDLNDIRRARADCAPQHPQKMAAHFG